MSKSMKKMPMVQDTSAWKNSKPAKRQANKRVRRWCTVNVTIEYTEDGDPFEVYDENVITRSQVHKVKNDIPRKVREDVVDIAHLKELSQLRKRGFHGIDDIIMDAVHAYMK